MGCIRYTVLIGNEPVANHMVLEHALILVEALFNKFFDEAATTGLEITVKSEPSIREG